MLHLIFFRIKQNIDFKKILAIQLLVCLSAFLLINAFQNYEEDYKKMQVINVGLDNRDNSTPTNMLINNFQNTEHFSDLFQFVFINYDEFTNKFESDEIDAGIQIPDGFSAALYNFQNKPLKLKTKTSTPIKNLILEQGLLAYSNFVKAVDIACYVHNDISRKHLSDYEDIKKAEIDITLKLLTSSLGRSNYFNKEAISEIPITKSNDYYFASIPLSFISFLALIGAINRIKEQELSINKKIGVSGISVFSLSVSSLLSELIFIILLFTPLIIIKFIIGSTDFIFRQFLSIIIAFAFFSTFWKFISNFIKNVQSLLIVGVSSSFLISIISGAIVPFLILSPSIKTFSKYSINFQLAKFSLGVNNLMQILPFVIIFILMFILDNKLAEKL